MKTKEVRMWTATVLFAASGVLAAGGGQGLTALPLGAGGGQGLTALPLENARWENEHPLGGTFTGGKYDCEAYGTQWNARAKGVPVSSNVTFTATFTPTGADGGDFKTAAIALYEGPRRFWHLALLETPAGHRTYELNELLDGTWCAQSASDMTFSTCTEGWRTNETYTLILGMNATGVDGVVKNAAGKTVFHRHYRHSGNSVASGRPVLKGYSIRGSYGRAEIAWQGEVAERPEPVAAAEATDTRPFWSVRKDAEGRWNFVSPDGKADFLAGCSSLGWHGDYNFKLGYAPYGRTVAKKYGTPAKWAKACTERLRSWGFSYATGDANFCDNTDFSYSRIVGIGQTMATGEGDFTILPCDGGPCTAFPNVFSPKWEAFCRYMAKKVCAPRKNDRRLVGWFIDNELSWWGDLRQFRTPPDRGLYDAAIRLPAGHSARVAAERLARSRGFADATAADAETRRAFVAECAERYFSAAARAIRASDPNHLVLGCRFAGIRSSDPVVWEACGRHCDVLSVNLYPVADLQREAVYNGSGPTAPLVEDLLGEVHRKAGKPLMITEWSFSALDSGLPCLHGAGQRFCTQRERAQAVGLFAKTMYGLPYMAGYLFFKWCDQPRFGRKSERSENTNYGLVNAKDEPYPEVTAALKEVQTNGAKWRRTAPPRGKPYVRTLAEDYVRKAARTGAAGGGGGSQGLTALPGAKGIAVGADARYTTSIRSYAPGHMSWDGAGEIEAVREGTENGVPFLDVTLKGKTGPIPFRVVERLYPVEGRGFFLAEHRAVENLSDRPLVFDQVFFRLVPKGDKNAQVGADGFLEPPKDGQPTPVPPSLWRPWQSGVWLSGESFCGLAAPRTAGVTINYWKGRNMHSDAVYNLGRKTEIPPHGRYLFNDRPYVVGAAGKGTLAEWSRVFGEMRAVQDGKVLKQWNLTSPQRGWWSHQSDAAWTGEGLTMTSKGLDPFLTTATFSFTRLSNHQEAVFRAKCSVGGKGEFFYSRPGDRAAPQALAQPFEWIGDGQWHTYRIRPFWAGQPGVVSLRIDLPADRTVKATLSSLAIEEVDEKPVIVGYAKPDGGVAFTVPPLSRTVWGDIEWIGEEVGYVKVPEHLHLIGDGKERRYYFDAKSCVSWNANYPRPSEKRNWRGEINLFRVKNAKTGAEIPLKDLAFCSAPPAIPAELILSATQQPLELDRAGRPVDVEVGLFNVGTMPAKGVRCAVSGLPAGVTMVDPARAGRVCDLPGGASVLHTVKIRAERPCAFTAHLAFAGPGLAPKAVDVPVKIGPSLGLPQNLPYIPEPKPLKGPYEIGAFYFLDWAHTHHWLKIWRTTPERRPAAGWYRNDSSELLDWQIKWAVENGISFYLVDWYGCHEGYFEKALKGARFAKYIKWALMWCNHTPPPGSSEANWTRIMDHCIRNVFPSPQYMKVNGMPYVSVWDGGCLERDNGKGGCRRMLEKARAMARAAGFKGIYFQAQCGSSPESVKRQAEMGFDETTTYHFIDGMGRDGQGVRAFDDVVEASPLYWRRVHGVGGIDFLPNLTTGWDDRPWHDGFAVTGRTVRAFRQLCREARKFADETGTKRFCLAPLQEWGEGSYADPNAEFGFGMFEAVRDAFFEKPKEGWPLNYTPADIGRGPYPVVDEDGGPAKPFAGHYWR